MGKAGETGARGRVPGSRAGGAVAFFDFDNTIIHGDAGPLFGKFLFRARRAHIAEDARFLGRLGLRIRLWGRYLPFLTWMGLNAALYKMRARRRSSLVRTAYKGLRGVSVEQFNGLLDTFVDFAIPGRIYPAMARELRRHLEEGRRCVIITTGMEPLIARCLRHLPPGVELIGCRLQVRKGRMTGRVVGPLFGVDKANILDAYSRALGIDPRDCWAYSDHWSDKEMLEAVGHAVAVNPRGRLRRLALRSQWTILEPRLDEAPAGAR